MIWTDPGEDVGEHFFVIKEEDEEVYRAWLVSSQQRLDGRRDVLKVLPYPNVPFWKTSYIKLDMLFEIPKSSVDRELTRPLPKKLIGILGHLINIGVA